MGAYVVAGVGRVGSRAAVLLRRLGHEVHAVSDAVSPARVERLERHGVRMHFGDARTESALGAAGIESAEGLLAVVDDDLANLEIALEARRLHPGIRLVLRIGDESLAARLEEAIPDCRCLSTADVAAPAFVGRTMGANVRGAYRRGGRTMLLLREDGPDRIVPFAEFAAARPKPAKRTLKTAWRELKVGARRVPPVMRTVLAFLLLLALGSVFVFAVGMKISPLDALYFVVTTLTTTGYGDYSPKDSPPWVKLYACLMMLAGSATIAVVYSVLTDALVAARIDRLRGRRRSVLERHTIIVGLGELGLRCARELCHMGLPVAIVDPASDSLTLGSIPSGAAYFAGDGRETDVLRRAGVERASAVLALTSNDAVNLSIALAAERAHKEVRTIVRMYGHELGRNAERVLKVDAAMSASEIAAPVLVAAAVEAGADFAYEDGDDLLVLFEEREAVRLPLTPPRA